MEHDRVFIGSDSPLEVLSIVHLISVSVSLSSAYIGSVATIPASIATVVIIAAIAYFRNHISHKPTHYAYLG